MARNDGWGARKIGRGSSLRCIGPLSDSSFFSGFRIVVRNDGGWQAPNDPCLPAGRPTLPNFPILPKKAGKLKYRLRPWLSPFIPGGCPQVCTAMQADNKAPLNRVVKKKHDEEKRIFQPLHYGMKRMAEQPRSARIWRQARFANLACFFGKIFFISFSPAPQISSPEPQKSPLPCGWPAPPLAG